MSTPLRTSVLSFVGALSVLLYILQTQSLPSRSCGFNLKLVQLVGRFGIFFPWVSIVVLFPPLHVGCPLVFVPEAALENLGLPQ